MVSAQTAGAQKCRTHKKNEVLASEATASILLLLLVKIQSFLCAYVHYIYRKS